MQKKMFKVAISLATVAVLLLSIASVLPVAFAQVTRDSFPRLHDIYFVIKYPAAVAQDAAKACTIDNNVGMISAAFVRELRDVYKWSISMNPGFHMCYLGMQCRKNPPVLKPGQPYITGAPYPPRGPDFEFFPMNISGFRWALNILIGCQKDPWLAEIFEFINVRLDTTVPPANVFYYNTEILPVPYDPVGALAALNAIGFSNTTGKWVHGPSGRELRPIYVLSPVEAPTSVALTSKCVDSWNRFFGSTDSDDPDRPGEQPYHAGTANEGKYFHNYPTPFYTIIDLARKNRDTDIFFLCWLLGRDPNSLYFFFHPDLDYYGGFDSSGLRTDNRELEDMLYALQYWRFPADTVAQVAQDPAHPKYVGMTVDDVGEMKKLCDEIQWWLYYLVPYIPLYSRNFINAYKLGLQDWVESLGYGSDNSWTYLWIHWKDLNKTSMNYHTAGPIDILHPLEYTSAYSAQVLFRLFDGGIAVNMYTHADILLALKNYTYGLFVGTTPGGKYCDGSKATFILRSGIKWHDGEDANAYDADFSWKAIAEHKTRQFSTVWLTYVDSEVHNATAITIYYNATGIWTLYSYAGSMFILPPQIYSQFTGNTPAFKAFKPDETPHPTVPGLTCLIGTGPFIFKSWDKVAGVVHVTANRNYWAGKFLREDVTFDGVVDMKDVTDTLKAFGANKGHPRWQYGRNDVNWDGVVDMKDITLLLRKFGKITLPP